MVSLKPDNKTKNLNKRTLHFENDITVEKFAENSA